MDKLCKAEAVWPRLLWIALSFFIVAFAQPDWSNFASVITSCCGFALFWKGILYFSKKKHRFWIGLLWFGAIQAIHLSWFTSDRYVGPFIFLVLGIIILGLGIQFGLLTLLIKPQGQMSQLRILGIASFWTLMEWIRLFPLTGFAWNPIGLSLSATLYGMQMASIVGLFGLTFWVILTNLLALKILSFPFSFAKFGIWSIFALFPYFFGYVQVSTHEKEMSKGRDKSLSVALVQTSLYPEQKVFSSDEENQLNPLEQWERILVMLEPLKEQQLDLIVLSESIVPYGTDYPLYLFQDVQNAYQKTFGDLTSLPANALNEVGNSYWAQAIANYFNANVIIGLEDGEENSETNQFEVFNAAFLFHPFNSKRERYEKRVLVPMGEYIPFQWCRSILAKYGILDSMTPGKTAKAFLGRGATTFGISICYEEIYGNLMRGNRIKGANLLVNLTNDVWYPRSRLPLVHFFHGKIRSVENGVSIVRSCNTGVTCGVDCLGRVLGMLPFESHRSQSEAGVLLLSVPLYTFSTLYTSFGDSLIIGTSIFFLLLMFVSEWMPFLFSTNKKESTLQTLTDEKIL